MSDANWHRRAALAALTIACLWVGWRALRLDLADHWAYADPPRALAWRADQPTALVGRAGDLVQGEVDVDRAEALARASLQGNPLEGRAYRVLGEAAERRGDADLAARLFEIAARRAPRDLQTHMWLARHYLAARQPAEAMHHLDMLLRVEPEQFDGLYPMLQGLATFPATQGAVVAQLAGDPPWRQRFLVQLASRASDSAAAMPVFNRLAHVAGGWSRAEAGAWLSRLGKDGRWVEAYRAWVDWLPPADRPTGRGVYNGDFEREPDGVGFGWRFGVVDGAQVDREPIEGMGGRYALHVGFLDQRVPFAHVTQWLALPPGRYRLQGRVRLDDLRNERGMQWQVSCISPWRPLGQTPRWTHTLPWQPFSLEFSVPGEGCSAQRLQLLLAARIPAEQLVGGDAWFDDLHVSPVPTP